MRYYSIIITSPSGEVFVPPGFEGLLGGSSYTSFVNGQTLPAAWDVMLDIPVAAFASPGEGGAAVQIRGVSLQEIAQANNLNGYNIQIFGGMQKGLPLATAAFNAGQSGLLVQGQIYQAFGNWVGTEMTLDFIVYPGPPPPQQPANLVLNWPAVQSLSDALTSTLKTGYPKAAAPTVSISANLVNQHDVWGVYGSMTDLADFVMKASHSILKGSVTNYSGVKISPNGNSFMVSDGTAAPTGKTTQLVFQDLIGQPTWIEYPLIQIKTVMRADINIEGQILLPKGGVLTTTTPQSQSQQRQSSVFQGTYKVTEVHHYGQFRQADAASWATVITAAPQPSSS